MKPLRIAIDARPLSLPMAGITRYSYELIRRLADTPHEWFLYLDSAPVHSLPDTPNVHIRHGQLQGRLLSTLFAQWQFPRWAREDQVELFWSPRHHLPLLLPKKIRQVLTIYDLVWLEYPETMSRFGRLAERLLMPPSLRRSDQLVTISEAIADDLQRHYPQLGVDVKTIYPGSSFRGISEAESPLAKPYFLFVGTLEPRKNLYRLLQAFELVVKVQPDMLLVIVGAKGWGGISLADKIAELGLTAQVVLTDRVSEPLLQQYYAHSLALVMPSLYEGFGLPLVEAMAYGVPVITSDCGATKEVAGEAGLLADPCTISSIAEAMIAMLSDELHAQLSDRARTRAKQFCWDSSAAQMLALLERVARSER